MDEHMATAQRGGNQPRPVAEDSSPAWLRLVRRAPALLGVVCGLAICLIAALALTLLRGGAQPALPTPTLAAQQVCADLMRQDYASLYGLLSTAQQSAGTEAQFEASQQQLDLASGVVGLCSVSVSAPADGQARALYTVTRGENSGLGGAATLTYVNGAWRLNTYDASVI